MVEVNGRGIEDIDRFVYLGATVSKESEGTEDIHNRVVKTRGVFLRVKTIWSSNSVSRRTKVRLYKTLGKPVLMYGCKTWKMNKSDENKIDVFQSRCLRRIFKMCWQERITNKEVLMMAEMENLNNDCRTALTWTPEGRRKRGRSRTTWRRTAEREREKARWKNWSEVQIAVADRAGLRSCVEALCAIWHEVDR